MPAIHAAEALLDSGWANDVRLVVKDGRIASVAAGAAAEPGDARAAVLLPGMPNLHSHAFQRGMAGLTEVRGTSADSFWTWREVMYRFALSVTPDQVEAIAAWLYVEMLEAGFTRVGEFHYLHHDRDGRPYRDVAEMGGRIAAAASATGLALTLLPVFYAHGGFGGQPATDGQRRFVNDLDRYERLLEGCRRHAARLDAAVVGIAPHSLRAATADELARLQQMAPGKPMHIHVAEQTKEVDDCLAWCGQRPVEWLLDHAAVDGRWCLVHATHMTASETERMAKTGAVAGLCPVTEANLGDGIFDATRFIGAGGVFGIGSDSNVLIGVGDELRQLEYSQRLRDRARNVLATGGGSTGRALLDAALSGGAQALGAGDAAIKVGTSADMVSLDTGHPALAGRSRDRLIDAWLFASQGAIDSVWVGGQRLVEGGRHRGREVILERFRKVMVALAA